METDQCKKTYSKPEIHMFICEELNRTYIAKNGDYGDSFAFVRRKMENAILVRLFDKVLRLETLFKKGYTAKVSESIDDTLLDLANYAIMELVERQYDEEKSREKPRNFEELEKRYATQCAQAGLV